MALSVFVFNTLVWSKPLRTVASQLPLLKGPVHLIHIICLHPLLFLVLALTVLNVLQRKLKMLQAVRRVVLQRVVLQRVAQMRLKMKPIPNLVPNLVISIPVVLIMVTLKMSVILKISVGNKASDVEDGSDADKITDAGKIMTDAGKIANAGKITNAGKIADAEHTKAGEALDNKQSHTAGFSMDTKDAISTENSKALDSQSQNLDNTSKTQQSLPVQDDESLVLSTPLKRPAPNNSDIDMDSPPDLQGASRMTGGIFRGKPKEIVSINAHFLILQQMLCLPWNPNYHSRFLPMLNMVMPFQLIWHLISLSNFQFLFSS